MRKNRENGTQIDEGENRRGEIRIGGLTPIEKTKNPPVLFNENKISGRGEIHERSKNKNLMEEKFGKGGAGKLQSKRKRKEGGRQREEKRMGGGNKLW